MAVNTSILTSLFSDIASAIRSKTGSSATIVADAFPSAISAISVGYNPSGTLTIPANGIYNVASYASVKVSTGTNNSLFYSLVGSGNVGSTFTDSTITKLQPNAFAFTTTTNFNLPNCTELGS